MISDYYVNLHFNQAIAQRTGYAFKLGDKGCTFHFHCEDLDPSGMLPHIVFNHPNNTCVEGVPTGSGRDYAYTIQGNEFAVIGKTVVDLKFYDALDATQRISTASFIIEILPDTYTPFEEASSSYADSLERAREEIDAAIIELQGAEHDLEEAETDLGNMSDQFADTLQDYIDAFGNTAPINPRGEYDPAEQYVPRDAVQYTAGGKTLTYINRSACTGIAPTDPDHGAAHWQIMIDVSVGGSFSALSDVSVDPQTLADGQMPVYNATGQVWENKTILENSLTSTATDLALTAAKGKELQDNKQDKELETPITVAGTSKTTVETALDGINAYVDDTVEAAFDVYGAKNLMGYPYYENGTTRNGITFTINDDKSITCTGTASADAEFEINSLQSINKNIESGEDYILSGCASGGASNKWFIEYSNYYNSAYKDTGSGVTVNKFDATTYPNQRINIVIKSGVALPVEGIIFKPMIYNAKIGSPKYAPPSKTNVQLTEDKSERKDLTTIFATGTTNTTGAQIKRGKFFYLNGVYCKATLNIGTGDTFTLNTNYKTANIGDETPTFVKLNVSFGNVTAGSTYAYNVTTNYPFITNDSIVMWSYEAIYGSVEIDFTGNVYVRPTNDGLTLRYTAGVTQNSTVCNVYIAYKA